MNKPPYSNNVNINSNYFVNQIDGMIVQLTKALAIEHSVHPDPDAKNMARKIIQDHINILIDEETKNGINTILAETISNIKSGNTYAKKVYDLLKLMRLDNEN